MTLKEYLDSIDEIGMERTWFDIIKMFTDNGSEFVDGILSISNFGELYEIGLAHVNKQNKKELGKYFTPEDVATLMAEWLDRLPGEHVCDVCCGVGNLILAYLKYIGASRARELIMSGRLWLYDKDDLALWICVNTIGILYGDDVVGYIHSIPGDFLDNSIQLPISSDGLKVISNPPYAKIGGDDIPNSWKHTTVLDETKELYATIMEKILCSNPYVYGTVLLTPQNYLGRNKFKSLRQILNPYNGFVVSFDNTPGQLFNGKKHGVFNTNHQNQVRPAILVTDNRIQKNRGIKVSGMVRFRNSEREQVLTTQFLEGDIVIGENMTTTPQIPIDGGRYAKCFPSMESLLKIWQSKSNGGIFKDIVFQDGEYTLNFVTTCRYNTVAYTSNLFRSGKRELRFKDEETRDLAYCFLNSSFCYWHWRLYDGEITYQHGLLEEMPVFFNLIESKEKVRLLEIAKEMQSIESNNIVRKKNSGKMMESIKFPTKYIDEIDDIFIRGLGQNNIDHHIFDIIHAHSIISC